MDKRKIKTETAIKKAYLRLLAVKDADGIGASDITDEAQVNRTTFYLHYGSAGDVWKSIEKDISDSVYARMNKSEAAGVGGCLREVFSSLTDEIDENKKVSGAGTAVKIPRTFADRFKAALADGIRRYVSETSPEKNTERYLYACTCVCSGATDAYILWLSRRDVPLDALCETIGAAAAFLEEPRT